MNDLYEQRIDAMKALEQVDEFWLFDNPVRKSWRWKYAAQDRRNTERLAAYKRKRATMEAEYERRFMAAPIDERGYMDLSK